MSVELVVDEALGPGLEIAVQTGVPRVVGTRTDGLWLGLDRAHVVDSDAGRGAELAAVVALPASSFAGCHVVAELDGALVDGERTVAVAHVAGQPLPPEAVVRTVARVTPGARWLGAAETERVVHEARQRFRIRRQEGRILGGRAWQPPAAADPGQRRFTTPHSSPEYRLDRLPPRFIRGLEGLLDDDERILYAIERPPDSVRARRLALGRGGAERRAGLLLLSDRQLIWMVDHLPPDRYLFDWGVDARLVALEALRDVRLSGQDPVEVQVATAGGGSTFALPGELREEAEVLRDLLRRFLPSGSGLALVRRYEPAAIDFDQGPARLFGQTEEALAQVAMLRERLAPEPLLGAFYAPRREGVPTAATVALTATRFALLRPREWAEIDLARLRDVAMTLSPLIGRVELSEAGSDRDRRALAFSYPATTASSATELLRLLRRAWADRASTSASGDEARAARSERVA